MVNKKNFLLVVFLLILSLIIQTVSAENVTIDCGNELNCLINNSQTCLSSQVQYNYQFNSTNGDYYNWTDQIIISNSSDINCSLFIETTYVSINETNSSEFVGFNGSCQFNNNNLTEFITYYYSTDNYDLSQYGTIGNCSGKLFELFGIIPMEDVGVSDQEEDEEDTSSTTTSNGSESNTTDYSCITDTDCSLHGESYYCSELTSICIDNSTDYSNDDLSEVSASVASLSNSINNLKEQLNELNNSVGDYVTVIDRNVLTLSDAVSKLEQYDVNFGSELSTVSSKIDNIEVDLEETVGELSNIESDANTALSGLEILEQDITSTKEEVSNVETKLEQRAEKESLLRNVALMIIVLVIFISLLYFILSHHKIRKVRHVDREVKDYLIKHIKSGSAYEVIRKHLSKAGWPDKEIKRVYNLTTQENYFNYLKSKGKVAKDKKFHSSVPPNNKKIIAISMISLLILSSLILFVSNSTGQAIHTQKLIGGEVDGTSGVVTYEIECTSPHILNEDGDYCCLDTNNNNKCDYLENREEEVEDEFGVITRTIQNSNSCDDNLQCASGLCIENECGVLHELYDGTGDCSRLCDYYSVKVSTSDGETYNVASNYGSYTAAGGLEWKVLNGVDHCQGEPAKIPIKISTKRTGETISEKVIILHEGENSDFFTHPDIDSLAFRLTIEDIYEVCE